jgi:hypothetical protein
MDLSPQTGNNWSNRFDRPTAFPEHVRTRMILFRQPKEFYRISIKKIEFSDSILGSLSLVTRYFFSGR